MKTAILVDGAFYRKRAQYAFGEKTPEERATELAQYCKRHLFSHGEKRELYRIFYYDCPPVENKLFHPLTRKQIDLAKTPTNIWMNDLLSVWGNWQKNKHISHCDKMW